MVHYNAYMVLSPYSYAERPLPSYLQKMEAGLSNAVGGTLYAKIIKPPYDVIMDCPTATFRLRMGSLFIEKRITGNIIMGQFSLAKRTSLFSEDVFNSIPRPTFLQDLEVCFFLCTQVLPENQRLPYDTAIFPGIQTQTETDVSLSWSFSELLGYPCVELNPFIINSVPEGAVSWGICTKNPHIHGPDGEFNERLILYTGYFQDPIQLQPGWALELTRNVPLIYDSNYTVTHPVNAYDGEGMSVLTHDIREKMFFNDNLLSVIPRITNESIRKYVVLYEMAPGYEPVYLPDTSYGSPVPTGQLNILHVGSGSFFTSTAIQNIYDPELDRLVEKLVFPRASNTRTGTPMTVTHIVTYLYFSNPTEGIYTISKPLVPFTVNVDDVVTIPEEVQDLHMDYRYYF